MARGNGRYLTLSPAERRDVAQRAIAKYNLADDNMLKAFQPGGALEREGTGHSPFEGEYAQQLVDAVLEQLYSKRKAFVDGWGIPSGQRKQIVELAVGLRKEHVKLGVVRERALAPERKPEPAPQPEPVKSEKPKSSRWDAAQCVDKAIREAKAAMETIHDKLDAYNRRALEGNVDYGHHGDVAHIAAQLKSIVEEIAESNA